MFEVFGVARWLDAARVPAEAARGNEYPAECARWSGNGRVIGWPTSETGSVLRRYSIGEIPIFARSLDDAPPRWGTGWRRKASMTYQKQAVAAVWQDDAGSIY